MGCILIVSIKVSVKAIKGVTRKTGDINGTCKRSLTTFPCPDITGSVGETKLLAVMVHSH